jgi:signal transduction histidine kinase/CheY-like chemotaxis protein
MGWIMSAPVVQLNVPLLEALPLPIMLRADTGQVLASNTQWRQSLGTLTGALEWQPSVSSVPPPIQDLHEDEPSLEQNLQMDVVYLASHQSGWRWKLTRIQLAASDLWNQLDSQDDHLKWTDDFLSQANVSCLLPRPTGVAEVVHRIPRGGLSHLARPGMYQVHDGPVVPLAPMDRSTGVIWLIYAQRCAESSPHDRKSMSGDLVQLVQLKDEFLACISHELKTPLTAVLGLSSLLKDQLLGQLNERQSHYAELIYQSGRQLMKTVNNMLDLTRIETGQLELVLEPVNIRQACDRVLAALQPLKSHSGDSAPEPAVESGLQLDGKFLSVDIEPGLEIVIADEQRLRQMLTNLLTNALKFTHPRDTIGLRVYRWQHWIAFTVWDTGIGIAEDKQHLLFRKFQQLERPMTRQFDGAGLGLIITQRLVRLHGGDITFTSEWGKGSEFTLLLPADVNWPTTPEDEDPSAGAVGISPIVLIAEVAPQVLGDLYEQLNHLNYRTVLARTGLEALDEARRLHPSAIFINPRLPLLSGWDVLRLLRDDPATQSIPVILLTTDSEMEQALHPLADAVLHPPLHLPDLQQCLEQLSINPAPDSVEPQQSLVLLHLVDTFVNEHEATVPSSVLSVLNTIHPQRCRILEVDDLNQAELLARIWKPKAILLSNLESIDPLLFLQDLKELSCLSRLPLIPLTLKLAAIAATIPGLNVFTDLPDDSLSPIPNVEPSAAELIALIQKALNLGTETS